MMQLSRVARPFRRLIDSFLGRHSFEARLRRGVPVLVYQMGKVGSLSVYTSLERQYPGAVVHAHHFSASHANPHVRRLHDWSLACGKPLNVISLTREPIGRNVSAFFQCFERETGVPHANAAFSLDELKRIFLDKYDHDIPLRWFDDNVLTNFGIDVYACDFPADGVATFSRGNIRLLVLRSEIDDAAKVDAVRDFLGLPSFQLDNTNRGDEKDYATTYRQFLTQVKLPAEYVRRLCESRYFRHFYSREAIEAAAARWSEVMCD